MTETKPETLPSSVQWWGMTHPGRFRKNNEDAFIALKFDGREVFRLGREGEGKLNGGDYIFAVSDGMGGANAGEFASRIAVDKITEMLPRSFRLRASGLHRGGADLLGEIFQRIHREMISMGRAYEETAGMGATLTLCWFTPEKAYFAHVGDSRLYHVSAGGDYLQVTHDHTHVGWLVRNGKLSELEARSHPAKSALQMALGGKIQSLDPQVGTIRYEPGDTFIFCTDGISDGVSSPKITRLVCEPNPRTRDISPAERLIDEAMMTSRDNMTSLVVRFPID